MRTGAPARDRVVQVGAQRLHDLAVFAADVARVNREVGNIPVRTAALLPLGQSLLNRVLMRAAEGREHEFAGVGLARRNRQAGAAFVNIDASEGCRSADTCTTPLAVI